MKIITLINVCKLISGVSYFNKNVLREKIHLLYMHKMYYIIRIYKRYFNKNIKRNYLKTCLCNIS